MDHDGAAFAWGGGAGRARARGSDAASCVDRADQPWPSGRAPRHLPSRRAATSFMRWQARRSVLNPLDSSPPRGASDGERSPGGYCGTDVKHSRSPTVWPESILSSGSSLVGVRRDPTARNWYRAYNSDIVGAHLKTATRRDRERARARRGDQRVGVQRHPRGLSRAKSPMNTISGPGRPPAGFARLTDPAQRGTSAGAARGTGPRKRRGSRLDKRL